MKNSKIYFLQTVWGNHILKQSGILVVLISNIIMLAAGLFESVLIGWIIDDGLIRLQYFQFIKLLLILIGCYLLGKSSSYFNVCSLAKLHFTSEISLNMFVVKHVQKVPLSYLHGKDSVYLSSRIYQDSDAIIGYCLENFVSVIFSFASIFIIAIIVGNANVILALALSFSLMIYICLYFRLGDSIYRAFYKQKEELNCFFSKLASLLTNGKFIKINSLENWLNKKVDENCENVIQYIVSYVTATWKYNTGCDLVKYGFLVTYIYYSGNLVFSKNLSVGEFVILLNLIVRMFDELSMILNFLKGWKETGVAIDRIEEIIGEPVDANGKIHIDVIQSISLNKISLGYDESRRLLEKFSYTFKKGKTYCIIGANGRGKSTLLLGLIGLLLPMDGVVEYNGKNILELDMERLRKYNIGFSEQEPQLIDCSLADNLYLDKEHIPMPDYIMGYLGDGLMAKIDSSKYKLITGLSGGEKQKISHARVIMKNPDLLIFDEPTSALDDVSRKKFLKILDWLKKDKIVVIVSHDDELVNSCDIRLNI